MSVKVNLGNKFANYENIIQEQNARINELTHLLAEAELFKSTVLNEKNCLKTSLDKLKENLNNLEKENIDLKTEIESKDNQIKELTIKLEEEINKFKDMFNTSKKLKQEIEFLCSHIKENENNQRKYIFELEENEKIKSKYEYDIIELTRLSEDLSEKVKSYETIVKQKDKYIDILLRKRDKELGDNGNINNLNTQQLNSLNTLTTLNTIEAIENTDNLSKKKKHVVNINNYSTLTILQNKNIELNEKIKQKDEIIKKLELEKNNLFTRIRNCNNNKK